MLIFEIKRMAMHNGPGIRTMVHFKGCNLNCAWCSTPESKSPLMEIAFEERKCIKCRKCAQVCNKRAISFQNEAVNIDKAKCNKCMACVNECCSGALSIIGKKYTAEEVLREILRDKNLFKRSGGGVTFSGGEVLLQINDEMLRLLKMLKEENISVGIDTAGCVKQEVIKKILPYVDFFLWDIKLLDEKEHIKYTDVGNKLILSNLEYLNSNNVEVILRCPIIPGVNNNKEHFEGIKELAKRLANVSEVHFFPLHHLGTNRYKKIGLNDPFENVVTINKSELEEWILPIKEAGIKTKIIG